jgi:hypothetical protein
VSDEDFAKDPGRNRLAVVPSRTNHMSYHLGQIILAHSPALILSGPLCHRLNAEGNFTPQGDGLPEVVDGNGMVSDACCIVRESRFVAL